MSVEDIVSMVKSKGAQLKMIEKKRQLSIVYATVTSNFFTFENVSQKCHMLVGTFVCFESNYNLVRSVHTRFVAKCSAVVAVLSTFRNLR